MTQPNQAPLIPDAPAPIVPTARRRPLDGVPHQVVGTLALVAVLGALALGGAWVAGGPVAAALAALLLAPVIIVVTSRRAASERDEQPARQAPRP